jgi:hypothetical protein
MSSLAPDTLRACGEALYGPRFASELARDLAVAERTLRRWLAGDAPPPPGVAGELAALLEARHGALAAARAALAPQTWRFPPV